MPNRTTAVHRTLLVARRHVLCYISHPSDNSLGRVEGTPCGTGGIMVPVRACMAAFGVAECGRCIAPARPGKVIRMGHGVLTWSGVSRTKRV